MSKGDSFESECESWGDNGDEANVQDDEDVQDSDDEPQHADDKRTDYEIQETNDDDEESEDEFVHTPPNYVPTDDEKNDESNDVIEEEYERINEELYGDVNVSNQVKDDAQATQKIEVPIPSSSISPNYAAKFLNFDNILPADTEVISMLDINVQHEVLGTSSLLTIPVSVIPKKDVINQSEIVTTSLAPTISLLFSSLYPALQQIAQILTPTITKATTSTTAVPDSETLVALQLRVTNLKKDVKELKDVDKSTKIISTIQSEVPKAIKEYLGSSLDDAMYKVTLRNFADIMEPERKQQVPKETITSSDTTVLEEFDQETTLFQAMTNSKSFNRRPKQIALYHALIESILGDEDAMKKGVNDKLKKRKPDNADKDEGPSAGSD
ncbi:hypothetical protein Tco_0161840 [Tanacetum coccineum]